MVPFGRESSSSASAPPCIFVICFRVGGNSYVKKYVTAKPDDLGDRLGKWPGYPVT